MEACEEVEEAISVSSGTKPTCRLQIESVSINSVQMAALPIRR